MFQVFEAYVKTILPDISPAHLQLMRAHSQAKKLRRKEFLQQEGEVCQCKIFVEKGLLRNYSIAENGQEYILRFTDAGSWTTDPESYYSGLPSQYYIEAIEPAEVVMFRRPDFEVLKERIPGLNTLSEKAIGASAALTQQRMLINLSGSAEEKYRDFMRTHPDIFMRVPLHMVASYLGVSRETLTRVRQALAAG